MIASQNHDQIYPALRPGLTSVPVKNYSARGCQRLQLVNQLTGVSTRAIQPPYYAISCLVFIHNITVPLRVEIFV